MNKIKIERVITLRQKSRQMMRHYGEPDWELEWELSELEESLTLQESSKLLEIESAVLF